ncbi:MAG: APC family permease [Candidatus Bathyarchaeia archaeon]|jgi:amino acid transporter
MSTDKSPSAQVYVRKSSGLIRSINPREALFSNLIGMGIVVNFFWICFASLLYPNADLPLTVPLALVVSAVVAYVYWMLSTAMPRTGGDYIYVGRILHPAIGFMVNFVLVTIMATWFGTFALYNSAYFSPIMLGAISQATGNPAFANLATFLGTQNGEFIGGFVLGTIALAVLFLPAKWIMRILLTIFAAQLIIYLWMMGVLLPLSHSDFVNAFNAQSGTTVQTILDAAQKSGVDWTITSYGTSIGIVYTILSFIGYSNSAYFAGEISGEPRKSQGIAIFVSPLVFGVVIYALYAVCFNVFGHDFLVASNTLSLTGNAAWTLPYLPTPTYLISFVTDNPLLKVLAPLGLVLTAFGFMVEWTFVPIRNVFAWSFDRILPMKFAEVDRRGVPWASTLLYAVIGYVSLYLAVYTPAFNYMAYSNFGFNLALAIVMFSAAVFPFLKKTRDIWNNSPSIVRAKIGPLPILTPVGVVGGVLCLWVAISSMLPALTDMPITPVYTASMLAIFVVAIVIYAISYFYQKSKGVPIDLVAKELPPL